MFLISQTQLDHFDAEAEACFRDRMRQRIVVEGGYETFDCDSALTAARAEGLDAEYDLVSYALFEAERGMRPIGADLIPPRMEDETSIAFTLRYRLAMQEWLEDTGMTVSA